MRGAMRGVAQGRGDSFWHPSPHPPNCYPAEGKSGGRWMKKGKVGEWFIAPKHLKVEAPLAPPWSLEPTITLIPNPANSNSLLTIPGYTYYKELPTEITLTRFFVVWHPFSSGIFLPLHQLQLHIFCCAGVFNCFTFILHFEAWPFLLVTLKKLGRRCLWPRMLSSHFKCDPKRKSITY